MTKKDKKIVEALGNSNSELVETGSDAIGKTNVVVIPDLTQELVDSKAFDFLHYFNYGYRGNRDEDIATGLRLGVILGKKLNKMACYLPLIVAKLKLLL